jgi:hypothetical protein
VLVPSGEPLRSDRLSRIRYAPAAELQGRRILSLAVPKRALPLAVAGTHAALLLSPREQDARSAADATVIDDVIVLNAAVADDTASVVVAVLEKDVRTVARLLGASDVFITQKVSAPAPPAPAPAPAPAARRDSVR